MNGKLQQRLFISGEPLITWLVTFERIVFKIICQFAPLEKNILDKSRASAHTGVGIRSP